MVVFRKTTASIDPKATGESQFIVDLSGISESKYRLLSGKTWRLFTWAFSPQTPMGRAHLLTAEQEKRDAERDDR